MTLCICFAFISCKKEEVDNIKHRENSGEDISITRESISTPAEDANELKYRLILPETLQANKPYNAVIEFESDFDKIIDPIQYVTKLDSTKPRVVQFFLYEPRKLSERENKKYIIVDSSFVSNKKFTVDNIIFEEKGEYLFQGFLFDEIMYNFYDEKGIRDSIHFDQRRQVITKKVVVID